MLERAKHKRNELAQSQLRDCYDIEEHSNEESNQISDAKFKSGRNPEKFHSRYGTQRHASQKNSAKAHNNRGKVQDVSFG